eukprot:g2621.t1
MARTSLRNIAIGTVEGRGRGLLAARTFREGQQILREPALASSAAPLTDEAADRWRGKYPALLEACLEDEAVLPLLAADLSLGARRDDKGPAATALGSLSFVKMADRSQVPKRWLEMAELLVREDLDVDNRNHDPDGTLPSGALADLGLDARLRRTREMEDAFVRALGMCHINSYQAEGLRCIFHVGSFINHDCNPNAVMEVRPSQSAGAEASGAGKRNRKGKKKGARRGNSTNRGGGGGGGGTETAAAAPAALGVWKACRPIEAGEEVTVSYIDCSLPVAQRQESLSYFYGFQCNCSRCMAEVASELSKSGGLPPSGDGGDGR